MRRQGSFAVIYGAPTPPGRLAIAAHHLVGSLGHREVSFIDVSTMTDQLLSVPIRPSVEDAIAAIDRSSGILIASPVYRASMPGALKCLIDVLPVDALKHKPVGVVAMGGSLHHYLAVDRHLRDVLAWFGALALPTSVYLTGQSFSDDGQLVPEAAGQLAALAASAATLVGIGGLGPEPLAARVW